MNNYKFIFQYASDTSRVKGEGTIKAENMDTARDAARTCVAETLNTEPCNVGIISMREYKPRKKKVTK